MDMVSLVKSHTISSISPGHRVITLLTYSYANMYLVFVLLINYC